MDSKKLMNFCTENGVLLDKDSLDFFSLIDDFDLSCQIILKLRDEFNKKFISKSFILDNLDFIDKSFSNFRLESVNEKVIVEDYNIESKKLKVEDFTYYFRSRFEEMKQYLENIDGLRNLISINKLPRENSPVSIIGLVYDKKITKNGNILLEVEDLTGKVKVLLNKERLYEVLDEVSLDCTIAINGSGGKDIIFANDVFFCEAQLRMRKKSNLDEFVAFIGDLHIGDRGFLEEDFLKFVNFLNGGSSDAIKIKYLFISGDLVSGIGVYPGQPDFLEINSLSEQYNKAYELLNKIRKDIKIIILTGNHEGVRLAEPQPKANKKYAKDIYSMENVYFTNNPMNVIIGKNKDFSGFRVLGYHGSSYIYYINNIQKFASEKVIDTPEKLMYYFLKNRHLAPSYSSTSSYPSEKDRLIIKEIPDIFISGHLHKTGVGYYNNILMVSCSSWAKETPYQKKFGLNPDYCKVPVFNLKTREMKVLDFEKKGDNNGN